MKKINAKDLKNEIFRGRILSCKKFEDYSIFEVLTDSGELKSFSISKKFEEGFEIKEIISTMEFAKNNCVVATIISLNLPAATDAEVVRTKDGKEIIVNSNCKKETEVVSRIILGDGNEVANYVAATNAKFNAISEIEAAKLKFKALFGRPVNLENEEDFNRLIKLQ